jgi:hypothetical protein
MFDGTSTSGVIYNVSTGVFASSSGTVAAHSSTALSNGWYRISLSVSTAAGAGNVSIRPVNDSSSDNFAGDGTSGLYLWGAQLEAGAFPTSYIKTEGTSATRSADIATIPAGVSFSSWYNQSQGTMLLVADKGAATGGTTSAFQPDDGTINNRHILGVGAAGVASQTIGATIVSGAQQTSLGATATTGVNRTVYACSLNDFAGSLNGAAIQTDISGTIPSVTQARIGSNGSAYFSGSIARIIYWPQRLPNATLQALTA